MKSFFVLIALLFAHLASAQLVPTNLVLFLDANRGVTEASGVVTNWRSYHNEENTINRNSVTNVAFNTNLNFTPIYALDYRGRPCVRFRWGASSAHPTNVLYLDNTFSGVQSDSITVYAVVSKYNSLETGTAFLATNWGFGLMRFANKIAYTVRIATNNIPSVNPAVYVTGNDGSTAVMRMNNEEERASGVGSAALVGGQLGGIGTTERFAGDIYCILVYTSLHNSTIRQRMVDHLAERYGVQMSHQVRVVCVGDSVVAGVGGTNNTGWPKQLAEAVPEVQVVNIGEGGKHLGTNGLGSSMYVDGPSYYDPFYVVGKTNWLLVDAGRNDINSGGIGPQAMWGRLTNFCRARTSAWNIAVCTLPDYNSSSNNLWLYNGWLRSNAPTFYHRVLDFGSGFNSLSRETRLNNSLNAVYFPDALHLTPEGYKVEREHWQQVFQTPRTQGGFW